MESKAQEGIVLTPQSFVCGARIEKYLGNLNFFLIRETSSLREAGGLSHFVQSFICEIQAVVRAHVISLGGNSITSYFMSEFVIMHNPHKNQVSENYLHFVPKNRCHFYRLNVCSTLAETPF